jgi:hypothetical protein
LDDFNRRCRSTAVLADIGDFAVEFFIGDGNLGGDLFCEMDAGVGSEEDGDDEVLDVGEVDEMFLVVKVDDLQIGVGFGLTNKKGTLCRLASVWLIALISRVVVWINFSFCSLRSAAEKLLQMCRPSLSDRIMPRTLWNYSTILRRNSVLSAPILYKSSPI